MVKNQLHFKFLISDRKCCHILFHPTVLFFLMPHIKMVKDLWVRFYVFLFFCFYFILMTTLGPGRLSALKKGILILNLWSELKLQHQIGRLIHLGTITVYMVWFMISWFPISARPKVFWQVWSRAIQLFHNIIFLYCLLYWLKFAGGMLYPFSQIGYGIMLTYLSLISANIVNAWIRTRVTRFAPLITDHYTTNPYYGPLLSFDCLICYWGAIEKVFHP